MEAGGPVDVARAWVEAVNARDVERVMELSDAEIEIVGPRGSGYGHALLRDWLGHAWLRLEPRRTFARGEMVVQAQHGVWRDAATGEVTGDADVASRLVVRGGRVALYARHDALDEALAAAGLAAGDEV
jgi:hypothetical protein